MNKIVKWFSSPTSKAGEVAIIGAIGSATAGTISWIHALPLIAYGVVLIVLPDNTVAAKDVESIVTDAINAIAAEKAGANVATGTATVPTTKA